MKHESFSSGVIYMLLSATGLALTGLLGKIGLQNMDLVTLIFYRFVASFILCAIVLWIIGDFKHGFTFSNYKLHLSRAVFVIGTQYCYYYYLEQSTLMNALVLMSTSPIIIPVLERVFLRHKIGVSTWVGIAVSFIGVLFVLQPEKGLLAKTSLIGLLAGFGQAASQVVFGINSKTEKSDLGVFYLFLLCALFSTGPFIWAQETGMAVTISGDWIYWLPAALGFASIFNQLFRAAAYRHSTPSRLASFLYFSVVLGGIWDWLFFDKIPNTYSIIGACLVVGGGLLKIYLRALILKRNAPR
ncbi:MAG: DMT family transporter [Verrucomicrobia bacterium]|nr:DMT family transporter [Verrucomicrobiota bacterium]